MEVGILAETLVCDWNTRRTLPQIVDAGLLVTVVSR